MKHEWKTIEVGNWYTEYQCQKCKKTYVKNDDDFPYRQVPEEGCEGDDSRTQT